MFRMLKKSEKMASKKETGEQMSGEELDILFSNSEAVIADHADQLQNNLELSTKEIHEMNKKLVKKLIEVCDSTMASFKSDLPEVAQ